MPGLHPDQADSTRAEAAFGFLLDRGYRLDDRFVSGGKSFNDGWRLVYSSPHATVTVRYFDMEFEVLFGRGGVEVDYLFVDRELFGKRSGFHGNMFPPQKLGPVIDSVAADIRDHFGQLLDGDATEWARVKRLSEAPKGKTRLP